MAVLAPFGFDALPVKERFLSGLLFASICSTSIYFGVKLLRRIFPIWFQEDGWTIGKEIALFLIISLLICSLIFLYILVIRENSGGLWLLFWRTVIKSLLISSIPISILVLWEQYHHQRKQLKKAQALNAALIQTKKEDLPNSNLIGIFSEQGKEVIKLNAAHILYLQADSNYVDFYYLEKDQVQKIIVRNRLKALFDQLPPQQFIHCHRSYIVNRNQILKVEGNARSLEIILRHNQLRVPVSRAKAEELSSLVK